MEKQLEKCVDFICAELWYPLNEPHHLCSYVCTYVTLISLLMKWILMSSIWAYTHSFHDWNVHVLNVHICHGLPKPFSLLLYVTQILGVRAVSTFWLKSTWTHQSGKNDFTTMLKWERLLGIVVHHGRWSGVKLSLL